MRFIKKLIPSPLLSLYHLLWAYGGAFVYGNPSHKLYVVGVTGTKGKSTTTELVAAILRAAGHKVAVASTIHFVINDEVQPNLYKMTMPGRARLQKFLYDALSAGCTHAVIEMTSEGAKQYRHAGIELDALVFTNLQPEHLESHGGMEAYANAKLQLARALERSRKRPRVVVANADDPYGEKFLEAQVEVRAPFRLADAEPYTADEHSARFVWRKGEVCTVPLPGLFNLRNALAALVLGEAMGIPLATIKKGLESVRPIAGRQQRIECGQPFTVIVDNAHTPDSLKALFETFKHRRCIGLIGSMGGGRDTWNRPEKGKVADTCCEVVVISDEDPCDEDPQEILREIAAGVALKKPLVILDRRDAIRAALEEAKPGDVVLLTGKGTDPYILRAKGVREPWSDANVAKQELEKLGYASSK